MAKFKICGGPDCITCDDPGSATPQDLAKKIERAHEEGKLFFCCSDAGGACMFIAKITHIERA